MKRSVILLHIYYAPYETFDILKMHIYDPSTMLFALEVRDSLQSASQIRLII